MGPGIFSQTCFRVITGDMKTDVCHSVLCVGQSKPLKNYGYGQIQKVSVDDGIWRKAPSRVQGQSCRWGFGEKPLHSQYLNTFAYLRDNLPGILYGEVSPLAALIDCSGRVFLHLPLICGLALTLLSNIGVVMKCHPINRSKMITVLGATQLRSVGDTCCLSVWSRDVSCPHFIRRLAVETC